MFEFGQFLDQIGTAGDHPSGLRQDQPGVVAGGDHPHGVLGAVAGVEVECGPHLWVAAQVDRFRKTRGDRCRRRVQRDLDAVGQLGQDSPEPVRQRVGVDALTVGADKPGHRGRVGGGG